MMLHSGGTNDQTIEEHARQLCSNTGSIDQTIELPICADGNKIVAMN